MKTELVFQDKSEAIKYWVTKLIKEEDATMRYSDFSLYRKVMKAIDEPVTQHEVRITRVVLRIPASINRTDYDATELNPDIYGRRVSSAPTHSSVVNAPISIAARSNTKSMGVSNRAFASAYMKKAL